MVENIFSPIQNKGWIDTEINGKGRNLIVGFLFHTELVLNIIIWIKKISLFEQVMDFNFFFNNSDCHFFGNSIPEIGVLFYKESHILPQRVTIRLFEALGIVCISVVKMVLKLSPKKGVEPNLVITSFNSWSKRTRRLH